jgi:hypothetical protein
MVKVNANEPVLVLYSTLDCIIPVTTEERNLETMKVKLPDLLYLIIVHVFVLARNIITINTYTTILIHAFLILLFGVECVSIYVIPLTCHNSEYSHESSFLDIHLFEYPMIEKSNPGDSQ